MPYNLRKRKPKKNYMPLLFYGLPDDILGIIAEMAVDRAHQRPYNLRIRNSG